MKILVVEDDRLLNNTLCYNLSAAGYEVDAALTKSVAERFCRKQEYDLIVLDINLPDGNGFDFCRDIICGLGAVTNEDGKTLGQ